MAAKTVAQLQIDLTSNAAPATAGFDKVTSSAKQMETAVDQAATGTSRSLGVTADAADELGGKAGKATGALGALSSGFELVGAEKYAGALQGAALATDFMSGVGDSLNLVMESTIVKNIRARAATVAHAAATSALAVKTAVMTGAQTALNVAMSLNPIALVVIAAVALIAGLALLYTRSERFRSAVQAVGKVGVAAFKLITTPVRLLFDGIAKVANYLKDRFPGAFKVMETIGTKVKNFLLAPFQAVKDIIDKIIDLISKISLPDLPDLNPFGRVVTRAGAGGTAGSGTTVNNYYISGVLTDRDAATVLERIQRGTAVRYGTA